MTEKIKDVHARCLKAERDEKGELTGAVCRKSRGHDDKETVTDPRRRAHFDPDRERIWGPDLAEANS